MATTSATTSATSTPTITTTNPARQARQQALADVRRERVLDAARAAFIELGMDKTSMREIAQRAGYTPGALYHYFASKEEVYGALLGESLDRLNAQVQAAVAPRSAAVRRLRDTAVAFFDFYRTHPRDLDLGFYLFQGMKPRGLTPALNEALNARLLQALQPMQAALTDLGLSATDALREVTALFAHTVGILVLSHTGRIRMFKQASVDLFQAYLEQLLQRAQAPRPAPTRRRSP